MQVIIDFEEPSAENWAGSIRDGSDGSPAVHFDGRLQLLRLLEAMIETTESDFDGRTE